MFSFFKKKPLLDVEESQRVVEAIRLSEMRTSGEIRVFIESKCKFIDPLDRAIELFSRLQMDATEHRNGTLVYVAMKDRQFAVYADEGIYKATGPEYWNETVREMLAFFKDEHGITGIVECVRKIGEALHEYFPYESDVDKNELPDEIVFGR
jgi:uncharacterized membrane protein